MEEMTPVEIFGSYMAWQAKKGTWIISFMNGTEYMYLLEGKDKALLLDTGYGAGNLRAFVEKLTSLPIIAANTHYHPDHAGGDGEFEEVYMSRGALIDAPSVETPGAVPFDLKKLPHPNFRKVFLKNGDTIDLGGRIIEVIEAAPAHCNSTLFYLDRTERMFFCGDDCESAQVIMFDNSGNPDAPYHVRTRLENMRRNSQMMLDRSDAYDWLLPNHNGTPIAKTYPEDYVGLVNAVFAGTAEIEDKLHHRYIEMDPKAPELCRVRYRRASIFIKKKELMKVYGKGE